jgi:hypothetical protein
MKAFENQSFAQNYNRYREPPQRFMLEYEALVRREINLVRRETSELCCCDVGAGTGTYSSMLGRAASMATRRIALEPADAMRSKLAELLADCAWEIKPEGLPLAKPIGCRGVAWVSDIIHLFPSAEDFCQKFQASLPNIDSIIVRLHLSDTISQCEWKKYFPTAFDADKTRHPSPEGLISSFRTIGYLIHRLKINNESFHLPSSDYVKYFENKSFSALHLLPENEFALGIKLLHKAASECSMMTRVIWRAVCIFRKAGS